MNNSIFPLVIFKDYQCKVRPVLYSDGNPGLVLEDAIDGSTIATASVNLPDKSKPLSITGSLLLWIKNWSENEGILEVLLNTKVIEHTGLFTNSGYIDDIPLCKVINPNLVQAFDQLYAETASENDIEEQTHRECSTELEYIFFG